MTDCLQQGWAKGPPQAGSGPPSRWIRSVDALQLPHSQAIRAWGQKAHAKCLTPCPARDARHRMDWSTLSTVHSLQGGGREGAKSSFALQGVRCTQNEPPAGGPLSAPHAPCRGGAGSERFPLLLPAPGPDQPEGGGKSTKSPPTVMGASA